MDYNTIALTDNIDSAIGIINNWILFNNYLRTHEVSCEGSIVHENAVMNTDSEDKIKKKLSYLVN